MSDFLEVIRQTTGGAPSEAPAGKMIRFPTSDKRGDKNGWCKRFPDGTGGVFGCWRQSINETWQASEPRSPEDRQAFTEHVRQARAEAQRLEEQRRAECRQQAAATLRGAPPATDDHLYLVPKGVKSHGLRLADDGRLIVAVRDAAGTLHGLQFIDAVGEKRFLPGTAKKGCYFPIGELKENTLLVCEGYATGASLHEATGAAVAIAFDAGNLMPVAEALRKKYPDLEIIVCADDDHATEGNPGLTKATEAARAVNGKLAVPSFPDTRGPKDTDFNDLARLCGPEAVRACIEAAMVVPSLTAENPSTGESESLEWLEPHTLPDGLPPVKNLEPEMILAPLRGWLMDISDRMQIPLDFSAAAAVVALGSSIGRGCGIYPKRHDDWLVVPNLWGAVVGRPSMMKTPAVSEGQRPLVRLETEAREEYEGTAKAFELDAEIMKITRAAHAEELKRALKKGDAEAVEAAREKLATLESDAPHRRRYQTQDGTTEKIGELLIENPRGLLVNRDELIGWFRTLDKDGREGDRSFYLEAWNGNRAFTYDRIGRGTLDIPALCVSVFGAMTPGPLSTYVYQANRGGIGDDGLLQRFQVFVWPDAPNEWKNVDRFPDNTEKNRAWEIFKALSGDIPGATIGENGGIPALRFSPGGQEVFDTWRDELETRLRGDHGLPPSLESHLTKYRKLMPSLALIFHLAAVADGATPGPVSEVSAVLAAAWCQYLESHAMRIYGAATMPGMEPAREIVKHIRRGAIKTGATVREIWRHQWARLTTPEEVRAGLEVLEQYDWLTLEKTAPREKGGRPSEIVRLNPRIKL